MEIKVVENDVIGGSWNEDLSSRDLTPYDYKKSTV